VRTSEIPFLLWRRQRTVHAILRGFLRWRKSDSDFPHWKRKILLSERTKSLPCEEYVSTSAEHNICDRYPSMSRSMRLGVDPCCWHIPPLSIEQQRVSSHDITPAWPSIQSSNLPYASTVLPVRGSETGDNDGTAVCAYPAGIDLATGEGVFVSPHYAGMSLVSGVDGRSSWRFVPVFVVLCLERAIRSAKVMCGKRRLSSGHPFRRSPHASKPTPSSSIESSTPDIDR
jgi:hypothetical protein